MSVAGLLQILLGVLKLGGFTHFIPSSVIKGMLSAIGILLISKQIPLLIGYDEPGFWDNQLFNIITLNHSYEHLGNLYNGIAYGPIIIGILSLLLSIVWEKRLAEKVPFIPASFVLVFFGVVMSLLFNKIQHGLQLEASQFVQVPKGIFSSIKMPSLGDVHT